MVPDAECEALRSKIAEVEDKIEQLGERQAEMERRLQAFQVAQYRALGGILAECLRLRHAVAARRAELSGAADDHAAAEAASRQQQDYQERVEASAPVDAELDDDSREQLKKLYRNAAMRCHPDRVADRDKAVAQERFQRLQRAYRQGDLAALRAIVRELDEAPLQARESGPGESGEALRKTLSALRIRAADLILALQTLQIDPDYRRALDPAAWQDYFDDARRGFELECEALQGALDELA